ncbi:hypothetical protein LCGC14_1055090 [marine sediment metagenome]|uniref:Uncharacterized protein n=1 Tax=marine sediment metagenome TaxID=412755 RepID=A0A0F9MS81_9ZZZZ
MYSFSEFTFTDEKSYRLYYKEQRNKEDWSAVFAGARTTIGCRTNGAISANRARQGYRCAASQ